MSGWLKGAIALLVAVPLIVLAAAVAFRPVPEPVQRPTIEMPSTPGPSQTPLTPTGPGPAPDRTVTPDPRPTPSTPAQRPTRPAASDGPTVVYPAPDTVRPQRDTGRSSDDDDDDDRGDDEGDDGSDDDDG